MNIADIHLVFGTALDVSGSAKCAVAKVDFADLVPESQVKHSKQNGLQLHCRPKLPS